MYGLISRLICTGGDGDRDTLIRILVEGTLVMPGCKSYVIARDPGDPKGIWITEVWESREHHTESLGLASVREAIERGKPLIERFAERFETEPVSR